MKIMNVILSVVCALVIGLSAMLYIQKGKAVRAGEERLAKISSLEADLADAQAKRDALATAREQLEVQLKSETTRARSMSADLLSLKRDNDAASERLRALASELRTKTAEVAQLAEARRTLIGRFTEELRNREVAVTEGGDSTSLELAGSTLFRPGQVELSEQGKEALKQVAERIKEMGDKMIRVEGHTDNRGGAGLNMALSTRRAAAVVEWLTSHGIEADRLTSKGWGQAKPLDSNETPEGRQNNRRVEFHITE